MMKLLFNKTYMFDQAILYITKTHNSNMLAGDGLSKNRFHTWLEKKMWMKKALISNFCTATLGMASTLANIQPVIDCTLKK